MTAVMAVFFVGRYFGSANVFTTVKYGIIISWQKSEVEGKKPLKS